MVDLRQLSTQDRRVLGLVRQGLDDGAIAATLTISPRTVAKSVERLVRLTGVRDRDALVDLPL